MPSLYSIIVLCHNHVDVTKRCLDCLFKTDLSKAEIIAVDNASVDGTWEYLRSEERLEVTFQNDENVGVGEGYNIGFCFAHTQFFVTLNNDMLIHDKDWLEKMRAPFTENLRIAQVGIEGTGCWLDKDGVGHPLPHPSLKPDYVETCCMMGHTESIKEVGPLFDPIYPFCYCEDSDLSLRLRAMGYEIAHIPLDVEHIGSVTLGEDGYARARKYLIPNLKTLQARWGKYLATKSFT